MQISTADSSAQTIEELTTRYQRLNEQKIQAQSDLKHAQDRLNELKKKAKEAYNTDDLGELEQLLDEMKRKNEEDRANYQASLDAIESELHQIDEKYNSAGLGQDSPSRQS